MRMEAIRPRSEEKDILGVFESHVVSKGHPAKEGHLIWAESTVAEWEGVLMDAIVCISDLIKEAVTALVTLKGHNETAGTASRLEIISKGLFNKTVNEKLDSVVFEARPIR